MTAKMEVDVKGLDDESEQMFTLYSNQDKKKKYKINKKYLSISKFIQTAIEKDDQCEALSLDIHPDTLPLIIEYFNHQQGKNGTWPKENEALESSDIKVVLSHDEWLSTFLLKQYNESKKDIDGLYELIRVAAYLGIDCLQFNSCATVACICRNKELSVLEELLPIKMPCRSQCMCIETCESKKKQVK
jgi:hypothetical protein